jgi:ectoine hydroxylase-related dioxygenase (phytanoyl-CoA dioxygenase family)
MQVSGSKSASRGGAPAGWPPHRDRGADSSAKRFRHDGTPEYATAWIALTPATPTNSCLYVVPKEHDVGYLGGDDGRNPLSAIFKSPLAFQHIRALPCDPGAVVVFSHRLLHWGSSADEKARQDKGLSVHSHTCLPGRQSVSRCSHRAPRIARRGRASSGSAVVC